MRWYVRILTIYFFILWGMTSWGHDDCLKSVIAFNQKYTKDSHVGLSPKVYSENFLPYLEKHSLEEVRNLTYLLIWTLNQARSLEDNLYDLKDELTSKKVLTADDERIVEGHRYAKLGPVTERGTLVEISKFLYIEVVTNGNLKRAVANYNDLLECPDLKVLSEPK
jgi:hypothetical protein